MKIENIKKDYVLSAVNIDKMSTEIKQFLQLLNIEKRNILRIHLSLEHALLKWQEHFGAECACTLEAGVRLGRPYLSLSVQGDVLNPFDETEDELENLGNRLLTEMGLSPEFSYQKEKNKVQLRLKKQKKNPVRQVLYAIVLAVVVGVAGKLLPEQVITYINEVILTSIFNSFLGLLCTIAGPMIFISVICGIYSIGDMTTFGKIGKACFPSSHWFFSPLLLLFWHWHYHFSMLLYGLVPFQAKMKQAAIFCKWYSISCPAISWNHF